MSTEIDLGGNAPQKAVWFDESKFKIRSRRLMVVGQPEIPTIIRVLVKTGLAKTEKQAITIILSILAIIVIICALLINRSLAVPAAKISPALLRI